MKHSFAPELLVLRALALAGCARTQANPERTTPTSSRAEREATARTASALVRPTSRTAIDPVSGRPVDKASAVIGRDEAGQVYYFENESTLARFPG